jgi:hypothetical protein
VNREAMHRTLFTSHLCCECGKVKVQHVNMKLLLVRLLLMCYSAVASNSSHRIANISKRSCFSEESG